MNIKVLLGFLVCLCGFIYALYSGKTTVEHALSAFHGNSIKVYDWEGNLLKEFTFDIDVSSSCGLTMTVCFMLSGWLMILNCFYVK